MELKGNIPGTRRYNRAVQSKIIARIDDAVSIIESHNLTSDPVRKRSVKQSLKKVASAEMRFEKLSDVLQFTFLVPIGYLIQLVFPFFAHRFFPLLSYSGWRFAGFFTLFLVCFAVILILSLLPSIITDSIVIRKRRAVILKLIFLVGVISTGIYVPWIILNHNNGIFIEALALGMLGSSVFLLWLVIILLIVIEPLKFFMVTLKLRRAIKAKILWSIINIIDSISQIRKFSFESIKRVMLQMEELAVLFERTTPSRIETFDKFNNRRVKTCFSEVANTIRELKLPICLNHGNSIDGEISVLKEIAIKVEANSWSNLPKTPLAKAQRVKRKADMLSYIIKTICIAFLPGFLVLLNTHYAIVTFGEGTLQYLIVVSALWLIINLLILIDPALRDKVATIKDIALLKG